MLGKREEVRVARKQRSARGHRMGCGKGVTEPEPVSSLEVRGPRGEIRTGIDHADGDFVDERKNPTRQMRPCPQTCDVQNLGEIHSAHLDNTGGAILPDGGRNLRRMRFTEKQRHERLRVYGKNPHRLSFSSSRPESARRSATNFSEE